MSNNTNYSKLVEQLPNSYSPMIELSNLTKNIVLPMVEESKKINDSLMESLVPLLNSINNQISKTIDENNKLLSQMANIASQSINTNLLEEFQETINTFKECLNFSIPNMNFNYSDLTPSIDFISSTIDELNETEAHQEEINFINNLSKCTNKDKLDYCNLIMLIATILTLLFTIMSYYKDSPYEKETYETIESIDQKLEELIELESRK